jgi:hypothetical protein
MMKECDPPLKVTNRTDQQPNIALVAHMIRKGMNTRQNVATAEHSKSTRTAAENKCRQERPVVEV